MKLNSLEAITLAHLDKARSRSSPAQWIRAWGPGLIVMLADTDAGCLITASQSVAQWGYTMILPQVLLIPLLYMAQEMTIRLGIVTQQGHGELIRKHFGAVWAWISAITLGVSALGALLTEFIGVAGVGELFGISKWITVPIAATFLIGIALWGNYRRIEKIGIGIGLAEVVFLVAMVMAKPQPGEMLQGMMTIPWHHSSYVYLVAANVGAVIMPWMIFYQQGAIVDKHLGPNDLKKEKHDTMIGTLLTQSIMIMFVITFAATVGKTKHFYSLASVVDLARAIGPFVGSEIAKIVTGLSLLGGSLVAAIVVSLAGTWGLTEVLGWHHSLNERFNHTNWGFYSIYAFAHIIAAVIVLLNFNLLNIAVAVEVMNALLLPIILGFLLILEARALPEQYRMHGLYRWVVTGTCLLVMGFGLYMIGPIIGIW